MPRSISTLSSSSSSTLYSTNGRAVPTTKSYTDFEVERNDKLSLKSPIYSRTSHSRVPLVKSNSDYGVQQVLQNNVSSLLAAKSKPFSISGHIPLEPGALTIFFRSAVCILYFVYFRSLTSLPCHPERHHSFVGLPNRRRS